MHKLEEKVKSSNAIQFFFVVEFCILSTINSELRIVFVYGCLWYIKLFTVITIKMPRKRKHSYLGCKTRNQLNQQKDKRARIDTDDVITVKVTIIICLYVYS